MKNNNSLYMPMYNKGKLLLTGSLILSTLFSCTKEKQEAFATETAVTSDAITLSQNLMFSEDFEESDPLSLVGTQTSTDYGIKFVQFGGSEVARFELRDSDPLASSGTRAEIKIYNAYDLSNVETPEMWYKWNFYIPSSTYAYDNSEEILTQFHQGGGESPSIAVETYQDKMRLRVRANPGDKDKYELGDLGKDKWQSIVMHIRHSHDSDGFIQIWRNGVKVLDIKGANSYDYATYDKPKWKLGIYKWDWNGTSTTDTKVRSFYVDNIKLGKSTCSLSEILGTETTDVPTVPTEPAPAPAPEPTPEPTPDPTPAPEPTVPSTSSAAISKLVLVDANTEKDLLTIMDGGTYSIKSLGTIKLNVRADASSATDAVNFVMSGPVKASYTDKAVPYALMGDDGKGNYYYGTWKYPPTGIYKITATPYADEKGDIKGTPVTITFTLTK